MNCIRFTIIAAILFAGCRTTVPALHEVATGWRLPTATEITGDWKLFAEPNDPVHEALADFNGDGIRDAAYIAIATQGSGWALFVNLNKATGAPVIIKLDENREGGPPQTMGLSVAEPGKHKTACGKGYWACEPGEPAELSLERPGIAYYRFESAMSFFWWDTRSSKFVRTWISD